MILDELVAILGFEVTGEDDLRSFQEGLDNAANSARAFAEELFDVAESAAQGLAAISGTVAGVATALTAFASQTADRLAFVEDAAERTGLSFKRMQELAAAGQIAGVEVGNFTGTLETMTRRLAKAARGTGQAKTALEEYGLSAVDASGKIKQADQFLLEVSDRIQTLSAAQQLDLAQQLGISREVLTMLRAGRKDIELYVEQAREAGLIFDERVQEQYSDFQDSLSLMSQTFRAIKDQLTLDYMPALTDVIDRTQEWLKANRDAIREDIGGAIRRTAENIKFLVKQIPLGELDFEKIGAGFIAFTRLVSKRLFWLQIAFVAFDDVVTGLRGGESFTKDYIDGLKRIEKRLESVKKLAQSLLEPFRAIGEFFSSLGISGDPVGQLVGKARELLGLESDVRQTPSGESRSLGERVRDLGELHPDQIFTPRDDEIRNEDGTVSNSTLLGMMLQNIMQGEPHRQSGPPVPGRREPQPKGGQQSRRPQDRPGFPFTAPGELRPNALSQRSPGELAAQAGQVTNNIDNSRNTDVDANITVNVTQSNASGAEIGSAVSGALNNELNVHSDTPVTP